VYNEVFNTLAKEDMDHMDEQESDFEVMQLLETETVFQMQNVLVRICGSVGQFVGAATGCLGLGLPTIFFYLSYFEGTFISFIEIKRKETCPDPYL
jgi:hypothetical protein